MTKKVCLWSAPRSLSTAFERSIMEIKDLKVFHEPYCASYYFGPERQSTRYMSITENENDSYHSVSNRLSKDYDGVDFIFVKDMAYHVENHFDILLEKDFLEFQHTFLVRHPRKSILSFYKGPVNKELTQWDSFDPTETGFSQMQDLFCFVKDQLHQNPFVVNADDLQARPKDTMKAYCEAVGFPFDENMLQWEPGKDVYSWHCKGWHEDVMRSTGFIQRDMKSLQVFKDLEYLPDEVQSCMKDSLTFYNFLLKFKLKF